MRTRGYAVTAAIGATLLAAAGYAAGYNHSIRRIDYLVMRLKPVKPTDNVIYQQTMPLYGGSPPARVTMIGDSLTQYGPWHRLLPEGSEIANFGVSGDTSRGLVARTADARSIGQTVFVMIGVNDESAAISLDETEQNIRRVLHNLRGRRIFLQSTLPMVSGDRGGALSALATFQREICSRTASCTFVDLATEMAPGGYLKPENSVDGIHLSWVGYQAWAKTIRPYL